MEQYQRLYILKELARLMSNKDDIKLKLSDSSKTDGKTIYIEDIDNFDFQKADVGHESMHIFCNSFSNILYNFIELLHFKVKNKVSGNFVKHIVNICEDVRINKILKQLYIGTYENLVLLL